MVTGGAARRYAQAIFELARDQDALDSWQRDLETMTSLVTDEAGKAFFHSPRVDAAQKRRVAEEYLRSRVQPFALNLARMLIERDRFTEVDRILAEYTELVRDHRGIAVAEVTTAVALEPPAAEEVRRRLSAYIGKNVELRPHVDPAIIGGVVARVGDYLIDGSVAGQLQRMRTRLAEGR